MIRSTESHFVLAALIILSIINVDLFAAESRKPNVIVIMADDLE